MRSARLTNKQRIIRLCLLLAALLILLLGGWMFVLVRPYRHWKPAAVTVQVRETEKNPYINPEGMTQESRILPPEGFTRTEAPPHSFLAFMRNQPLYENGSLIYTYDGGSPGHAVLIADEAVNETGERVFLLANGYMPAQSAYILAGYNCDPNPWYTQAQLSADPVCLSTYTFEGTGILRRHTGAGIN